MTDFLTRLAERALGATPAVQPLVPPIFAPEPTDFTSDQAPVGETRVTLDDPPRSHETTSLRTLEARDSSREAPQNATDHSEDPGSGSQDESPTHLITVDTLAETLPSLEEPVPRLSGAKDVGGTAAPNASKVPRNRSVAAESNEDKVAAKPEAKDSSPAKTGGTDTSEDTSPRQPGHGAARSPQLSPVFGTVQQDAVADVTTQPRIQQKFTERARPDDTQRSAPPAPRQVSPEDGSDLPAQQVVAPETLSIGPSSAEKRPGQEGARSPWPPSEVHDQSSRRAQSEPLYRAPSQDADTLPEANETVSEAGNTSRQPASPAVAVSVAKRVARPHSVVDHDRVFREPFTAPPEAPASTIMVEIGRIDVRAVTPPPAPAAPREAPDRSSPSLSLEDYLKERSGGRR
jgi:hypothetical protein